jgi:hypothetical protein
MKSHCGLRVNLKYASLVVFAGFVALSVWTDQAHSLSPWMPQIEFKSRVQKAGLLNWLTGKNKLEQPQTAPQQVPEPTAPPQGPRPQALRGGTYRTLCVRTCDGYYFPIRSNATRSNFSVDSQACLQRCSSAVARLFVHRYPGQEVANAVDLEGNRYGNLENAFRYRKERVAGCECQFAPWTDPNADRN